VRGGGCAAHPRRGPRLTSRGRRRRGGAAAPPVTADPHAKAPKTQVPHPDGTVSQQSTHLSSPKSGQERGRSISATLSHALAHVTAAGCNGAEASVNGGRGRLLQIAKSRTGGSPPELVASKCGGVSARHMPAATPNPCCGGAAGGEERRRRASPPTPPQRHQERRSPTPTAPCPIASCTPPAKIRP